MILNVVVTVMEAREGNMTDRIQEIRKFIEPIITNPFITDSKGRQAVPHIEFLLGEVERLDNNCCELTGLYGAVNKLNRNLLRSNVSFEEERNQLRNRLLESEAREMKLRDAIIGLQENPETECCYLRGPKDWVECKYHEKASLALNQQAPPLAEVWAKVKETLEYYKDINERDYVRAVEALEAIEKWEGK